MTMKNAERFVELLQMGKLKKHTLPNTAPNYIVVQEQKDLRDYNFYLCSFEFDELRKVEVESYYGDEQV